MIPSPEPAADAGASQAPQAAPPAAARNASSVSTPDGTPAGNPPRRRRRWPALLRIVLVLGLLAWASSRVDMRELAATLRAADGRFLALAALGIVLSQFTAAWRWFRLLKAAGSHWSFARSLAVYAAGLFLGLFIPTGVGGDVYRIARMRGSGAGFARGTVTILLERAIGLWALLLLGCWLVWQEPTTRPWAGLFWSASAGGLVGFLALAIPGGPEWIGRLLGRRVREAFPPDSMDALRSALPGTLGLSLLNHSWLVLVNLALAHGLALATPALAIAAAVPLVLLAAQVPIAPGGLGVREAGYVFFLGRVGVPQSQALAVALGWLALLLAVGLLGSIGLFADREAKKSE